LRSAAESASLVRIAVTSRFRTSLVRMAAALVAWLLVASDLLGYAHQAAEVHAVCAEHGELVHADATHGESIPELRDIAPDAEVADAPGVPHDDEHGVADHCRACAAAHDPVTVAVTERAPELAVRMASPVVTAPVTSDVPRPALYRAAPKTSPPVA
jgi:hypothetical protein